MNTPPIKILLVEANEGDILKSIEALDECQVKNVRCVLKNGSDALNFLISCSKSNKDELPDLILLDINLPNKNGNEVLQSAKNHPELKHIPIIIISSSSSKIDILKAYQEHANCHIIKPHELADYVNVTC